MDYVAITRCPARYPRHRIGGNLRQNGLNPVLCRNLVFTYFAPGLQETLQRAIAARLAPGGYLAIGAHERLPAEAGDLVPLAPKLPIYRKAPATA